MKKRKMILYCILAYTLGITGCGRENKTNEEEISDVDAEITTEVDTEADRVETVNEANHIELFSDIIDTETYNEQNYYVLKSLDGKIFDVDPFEYIGDYDLQQLQLDITDNTDEYTQFGKSETMDYKRYTEFCEEWNIDQIYTDDTKYYTTFVCTDIASGVDVKLCDVVQFEDIIELYIHDNFYYNEANEIHGYTLVIPTDEECSEVHIHGVITEEEFNNIKESELHSTELYDAYIEKPVIYTYPKEDTTITVKLLNSDRLTCSYPKYTDESGWQVKAKPDGTLTYEDKQLYCLYYESKSIEKFKVEDDGFIVKGSDAAQFLEEKLSILGLNDRESEEFIIYWLPRLESNKYNYIRFATTAEIEENMGLEVNPIPDTTIRVFMTFKGLDTPIEISEQKLEKVERKGYTVVEWGGTEIK